VAIWIILCKSFSGFGVANFLPLNNFINSFVPFVAANPDNDARGNWIADPFDAPNVRENLSYEIINPNTNKTSISTFK
jgi:hypothetical protein